MAHFAELDENNVVLRVIVVDNEDIKENGAEKESKGVAFCKNLLGQKRKWVQTSYNNRVRKQYAGIGYLYDDVKNKFISKKPYPSWSLDNKDDWEAPVTLPNDGKKYSWNEGTQTWDLKE